MCTRDLAGDFAVADGWSKPRGTVSPRGWVQQRGSSAAAGPGVTSPTRRLAVSPAAQVSTPASHPSGADPAASTPATPTPKRPASSTSTPSAAPTPRFDQARSSPQSAGCHAPARKSASHSEDRGQAERHDPPPKPPSTRAASPTD